VVLLGGSVLGPLQQIHLREGTSLSKHVAFGLIFAAPLIGALLAALVGLSVFRIRRIFAPVVLAVLCGLTLQGLHFSGQFLTAYPDDITFQGYLRQALVDNPNRPILAEQSSAQRYELRTMLHPWQWTDTYVFRYRGVSGLPAYRLAIHDHYFGVIYLNFSTTNSHEIVKFLGTAQGKDHYYHLVAQVPGDIRGRKAGSWLMWTPQTKHFTYIP